VYVGVNVMAQVFMSKESLEVGVVSKGDLPQNLWAR
jgi:hypothetical protein